VCPIMIKVPWVLVVDPRKQNCQAGQKQTDFGKAIRRLKGN